MELHATLKLEDRMSKHECNRDTTDMRRWKMDSEVMEVWLCEMKTHSLELNRLEILEENKVEWTWLCASGKFKIKERKLAEKEKEYIYATYTMKWKFFVSYCIER